MILGIFFPGFFFYLIRKKNQAAAEPGDPSFLTYPLHLLYYGIGSLGVLCSDAQKPVEMKRKFLNLKLYENVYEAFMQVALNLWIMLYFPTREITWVNIFTLTLSIISVFIGAFTYTEHLAEVSQSSLNKKILLPGRIFVSLVITTAFYSLLVLITILVMHSDTFIDASHVVEYSTVDYVLIPSLFMRYVVGSGGFYELKNVMIRRVKRLARVPTGCYSNFKWIVGIQLLDTSGRRVWFFIIRVLPSLILIPSLSYWLALHWRTLQTRYAAGPVVYLVFEIVIGLGQILLLIKPGIFFLIITEESSDQVADSHAADRREPEEHIGTVAEVNGRQIQIQQAARISQPENDTTGEIFGKSFVGNVSLKHVEIEIEFEKFIMFYSQTSCNMK